VALEDPQAWRWLELLPLTDRDALAFSELAQSNAWAELNFAAQG